MSDTSKRAKEAEKRRRRRQRKKEYFHQTDGAAAPAHKNEDQSCAPAQQRNETVVEEVEYVPDESPLLDEPEFQQVLDKFSIASSKQKKIVEPVLNEKQPKQATSSEDDNDDEIRAKRVRLSNRRRKKKQKVTLAELKDYCGNPDVVEVWDATAADPRLLVFLKACRNTVPVPRHWCQRRSFLQRKEKRPFHLPDFIAATGIQKIRQAYMEKENTKKAKQKQRSRMQAKTGKLSLDYQILHDAFFKYQTKPRLTILGDLYHEGKEIEMKLRKMRPGYLSRELKSALGMADGAPPPWLFNMQRYGPPPAYPELKVPGLNAPVPEGASFGYHPGGWGQPPVDEFGKPLYGDVFGTRQQEPIDYMDEPVDRFTHWGDFEDENEDEYEEEQEEEEDQQREEADVAAVQENEAVTAPVGNDISATPTGSETPEVIDLRKSTNKLYQVLEERKEPTSGILLGTTHTYILPSVDKPGVKKVDLLKSQRTEDVDITLRPEELEKLDETALAAKFEQARKSKQKSVTEDFSAMVAADVEKKRKRQTDRDTRAKKVGFKF